MKKIILLSISFLILGCATPARSQSTNQEAHQDLVNRTDSKDKKVEIFWVAPLSDHKKLPTVVYIHGVQDASKPGALNFAEGGLLKLTANLGYLAVGMSMPGYGHSSGEADFCGQGSQLALRSVLTYLRSRADVDQGRIIVSGISCGATVAAMVADKERLTAMVLISGVYDFKDMYKKWHTSEWALEPSVLKYIEGCVQADGGIKSASILRSALPHASHFKVPVLFVAGGKDRIVDEKQSISMDKALKTSMQSSKLILNAEGGHMVSSYEEWVGYVDSFAHDLLKK